MPDVPVIEIDEVVTRVKVEEDVGPLGTVEFDPGNDQGVGPAVPYLPDGPDLVMVGDRDPDSALLSIFQDLPDGRGGIRMACVNMHVRGPEPVP